MKNNLRVGNIKRPGNVWLITLMLLFIATCAAAAPQYTFTCVSCHGTPPTDSATRDVNSGNFAGNHSTHSTANILSCNKCHIGPTTSNPADMSHKNGQISLLANINSSIQGSAQYAGIATFKNQTSLPVLGTCTNVNCHFEKTTITWGTTPTWGSTKLVNDNSANCAQCHLSTGLTTGAHPVHITDLGGSLTACNSCHRNFNGIAGTAAFLHATSVAASITLQMSPGTYAGGRTASNYLPSRAISATGTCSATNCHGSGAPAWNATTGTPVNGFPYSTVQCTKCHGSAAAPFYSTAIPKVSATSDPKVGAHAAHLTGSSNISNPIACTECHIVPALVGDAGHMNGSTIISFTGPIATANGTLPTASTTTCGTTWCHGGNTTSLPQNIPARTSPTWSTPFVTGTSSLGTGGSTGSGYCANCHGYPPSSHATNLTVSACNGCHGHLNTDGLTFNLKSKHIDGTVDGSSTSCAGCHSYDTTNGGTTWGSTNYGGFNEGIGAHAKHIEYIKKRWKITLDPNADYIVGFGAGNAAAVCGVCHSNNAAADHSTGNQTAPRNINFNGSTARASWSGAPAPSTWYGGSSGTSSNGGLPKKCSNIDCHYFTTPFWSTY